MTSIAKVITGTLITADLTGVQGDKITYEVRGGFTGKVDFEASAMNLFLPKITIFSIIYEP